MSASAQTRTFSLAIRAPNNGHSLSAIFPVSPSLIGYFGKEELGTDFGKAKPAGVRQLLDANRADGVVTEADWLGTLSQAAGPTVSSRVKEFVDHGVPDPRSFWAGLFEATGVRFVPNRDTLQLLDGDGGP